MLHSAGGCEGLLLPTRDWERTFTVFRLAVFVVVPSSYWVTMLPAELREQADDFKVQPCVSVLRMGFSWALWIAQHVHVHIASVALPDIGGQFTCGQIPATVFREKC